VLQYESVNNLSVGRSVEETLRVLSALQTGELCPLNWKPGQKTLGK
jgi:peroxiredoxin (alkyl hydroperoxide reductase subunit C)